MPDTSDQNPQQQASDVLEGMVRHNHHVDTISFFEIKTSLHERGFGILLMIFILPLAIPMPYPPGMTTILVIPVSLFSIQMLLGFDSPWLPKWLERRTIKRATLAKVIEKTAPSLRKVEKLLRHRWYFSDPKVGERVAGFFCVICSASIAVPLPLTNLLPGIGILIISLAILSKDGITMAIGIITGISGVLLSVLLLLLGKKVVLSLLPFLQHIF